LPTFGIAHSAWPIQLSFLEITVVALILFKQMQCTLSAGLANLKAACEFNFIENDSAIINAIALKVAVDGCFVAEKKVAHSLNMSVPKSTAILQIAFMVCPCKYTLFALLQSFLEGSNKSIAVCEILGALAMG
jgi:hypothetical protein